MDSNSALGNGKISKLVIKIALPSMLAQFVNVLYSIVDRIFVGNIPEVGKISLAGVGVCGPIVTMIGAFAFLIGIGGAPLMGIATGEGDRDRARKILSNSFIMLVVLAVIVTVIALLVRKPMLSVFGASPAIFPYAEKYFVTYVCGTIFALLSIGLNQFIIVQGYSNISMISVIIGAVLNIALDPLFIFVFHMGVQGAALATIISQCASAVFAMVFLFVRMPIKITFGGYSGRIMGKILTLGLTPFLIIALDNIMIIAMNALLQKYGGTNGDNLITINTIVQSFMLILTMPLGGISGSTQSILSYNYGAGHSKRVLQAQKYILLACVIYTAVLFVLARVAGKPFVKLFTSDPELVAQSLRAMKICTLATIPLGIQYALVDGFTGMGLVKFSLPSSFFRKGVYFISLFLIPVITKKASMIFYAEPISDIACVFLTVPLYLLNIKKILRKREEYLTTHHIHIQPDDSTIGENSAQ